MPPDPPWGGWPSNSRAAWGNTCPQLFQFFSYKFPLILNVKCSRIYSGSFSLFRNRYSFTWANSSWLAHIVQWRRLTLKRLLPAPGRLPPHFLSTVASVSEIVVFISFIGNVLLNTFAAATEVIPLSQTRHSDSKKGKKIQLKNNLL